MAEFLLKMLESKTGESSASTLEALDSAVVSEDDHLSDDSEGDEDTEEGTTFDRSFCLSIQPTSLLMQPSCSF